MREQLQNLVEQRVRQSVSQTRNRLHDCPWIERKKESCARRGAEIVRSNAVGNIIHHQQGAEGLEVFYRVHYKNVIKQKNELFLEEVIEQRKAEIYKGVIVEDEVIDSEGHHEEVLDPLEEPLFADDDETSEERATFKYDRLKAVQYAERWWNDYNPAYKKFDVDCTNYISQCLHAGGAPMRIFKNRAKGWWMFSDNWSFSWSVANSMRWYLPGAKTGVRAKEMQSADQLQPGDVICYDFQGDGRYDHTTIVTAMDANGMPLVNAHTANSRARYWAYEDSTAYTPNIKYKFLSIIDDQ